MVDELVESFVVSRRESREAKYAEHYRLSDFSFLSEQLPNLCTSVARSNFAAVPSLIQTSLISLLTTSSSLQASRINYYPTI